MKHIFLLLATWCMAIAAHAQDATANPAEFTYSDDLQERAERGDMTAQFQLGYCYYYGRKAPLCPTSKVAIKRTEAHALLQKAAQQGHVYASFLIGCFYFYGYPPCKQDDKKARDIFESVTKKGCIEAYVNLSMLYGEGRGVKADKRKSEEYMLMAANAGNMQAQYNMYIRLFMGVAGTKIDKPTALVWLQKSADQGYLQAINDLAVRLMNGEGINADPEKAVELMQKAAELGFASAWHNLGVWYYNGFGVEMNREEATRCFYKGYKMGYSQSMQGLQECFQAGAYDAIAYGSYGDWLAALRKKESDATHQLALNEKPAPAESKNPAATTTTAPAMRRSPVDVNIPKTNIPNDNTFVVILARKRTIRKPRNGLNWAWHETMQTLICRWLCFTEMAGV